MLVKEMVYNLCLYIFLFSIFTLIYSTGNKNKIICKYTIILSIIYIIYALFDIGFLPYLLNLDIGFEMLLFYGILVITILLFMVSIIKAVKNLKKLENSINLKKYKIILSLLILLPLFLFGLSYFKEIKYINNSKLILVCSEGSEFDEEDFAYAIGTNYSEKVTIGSDSRGAFMENHLPNSFRELNYLWSTDEVKITNNRIIIYRNDENIFETELVTKDFDCNIEEVFFKED